MYTSICALRIAYMLILRRGLLKDVLTIAYTIFLSDALVIA